MTNKTIGALPLLPDQRPPKFPASLGACLTRNGDESHLRILQRQYGDWNRRERSTYRGPERKITDSPRRRRDGRFLSQSQRSAIFKSYLTEHHDQKDLNRFRHIARTVRIIASVCLGLKSYVKKKTSHDWSFIEMYLYVQKDMKDTLVFNPYNFLNDESPPTGNERLKRALTMLPSLRTPADILLILTFIRNNKSFKDYPPYTQIEMCKCMILQNYESRRIVIKQGQMASAFYVVMSGTLLINVTEINPHTGKKFYRSCAELKEGNCFGEVGLLERCTRTASVICKTDCQLLLILQDDFDRLIRQPLLQQRQDHVTFCQSISLFQHFPCEKLESNQIEFFYQYFPKETIIASEAGEIKYLIVIMTGKCRLINCIDVTNTKNKISLPNQYNMNNNMRRNPIRRGFRKRSEIIDLIVNNRSIFSDTRSNSYMKDTLSKKNKESSDIGGPPRLLKSRTVNNFYEENEKNIKIKDDTTSNQVFAQLAELTPGSVFGLESIVNGERRGLKIISDGVECLFVSKRLFLHEANIKVLSIVNDMVMTFPSEEEITSRVEEHRNWLNYKQRIVRKSLHNSKYLSRQKTVI
ncbi:cyclic nucleotide-binding domain-containing protein 2 [Patella vulgata]|uniref:cyclic nucleotide-binding domain-containing protein 2 n=1 Tax=Patella vulgata TaxID=6465 RepID=UPI00217FC306|nr:cyclic nucleotide-binding domain-containing protein 2 [Patella vulgata]